VAETGRWVVEMNSKPSKTTSMEKPLRVRDREAEGQIPRPRPKSGFKHDIAIEGSDPRPHMTDADMAGIAVGPPIPHLSF
jgi:hypothetical protein